MAIAMAHMIDITLPDGTKHQCVPGTSIAAFVKTIGGGLGKVAVAATVDGTLCDLTETLEHDATVHILTVKDDAALEVIRHSCAHLLAHAVKNLFPTAKMAIGPVIEHGFYYDFSYPEGFKDEDLVALEGEMKRLVKAKMAIDKQQMDRSQAIDYFSKKGESYKLKLIEAIAEGEVITVYEQGDFVDLCRGPHVPHTGFLKAFKLTKLAGAYWRGDHTEEMLQRIYGTAWGDGKALQAHVTRIEEAKKRDHRLLAKKMDLFHLQEDAPGMVFWHPNGWQLYQCIRQHMRRRLAEFGYQEVRTPVIAGEKLWQLSGHAEKFSDDMFFTESEQRRYAVKPMNCPLHIQIYNQGLHSYRDLPIRLAEFGCCHRNEPSGSLHGLMRVRGFEQDDAHIFCTLEQVAQEAQRFVEQLFVIYKDFGFSDVLVKLSTRPEQRVGEDALWDQAEKALEGTLQQCGLEWALSPGEGAFYGPKIEFSLRDSLGRVWQCGTIQLDFFMPQRLSAHYIDANGDKQVPVMLHRAVLGSFERFIAILLEHYGGNLPLWLAPIQVMVLNITDDQAEYAKKVTQMLQNMQVRAKEDLRNEKIGFKIRNHAMARVPLLVIVGADEVEKQTVSLRTQLGKDLGQQPLDAFLADMATKAKQITGD
jgi:threonyl-tRNA synthetase